MAARRTSRIDLEPSGLVFLAQHGAIGSACVHRPVGDSARPEIAGVRRACTWSSCPSRRGRRREHPGHPARFRDPARRHRRLLDPRSRHDDGSAPSGLHHVEAPARQRCEVPAPLALEIGNSKAMTRTKEWIKKTRFPDFESLPTKGSNKGKPLTPAICWRRVARRALFPARLFGLGIVGARGGGGGGGGGGALRAVWVGGEAVTTGAGGGGPRPTVRGGQGTRAGGGPQQFSDGELSDGLSVPMSDGPDELACSGQSFSAVSF